MRRHTFNQFGFGVIGIAAVLLFVAVVGGVGYKVTTMNNSAANNQTVTSKNGTAASSEPATIKTQADLTATGKSLDASDGELNNSLDDGSLDADLRAML